MSLNKYAHAMSCDALDDIPGPCNCSAPLEKLSIKNTSAAQKVLEEQEATRKLARARDNGVCPVFIGGLCECGHACKLCIVGECKHGNAVLEYGRTPPIVTEEPRSYTYSSEMAKEIAGNSPEYLQMVVPQDFDKLADAVISAFGLSAPIRGQILDRARSLTLGDRNQVHGDPIPMMRKFMELAKPLFDADVPDEVKGALILGAYKTARVLHNANHRDSFEDLCAYGAIAGEAAARCKASDGKEDSEPLKEAL